MKLSFVHHMMTTVIVVFVIVLTICLPGTPVSADNGIAIVSISFPLQTVSPGAQFTVNVTIQPNSSIAGAQFNLSFNPARATVNSVTQGNLFNKNGDPTYFSPGQIDNVAGIIKGVAGTITVPGRTISSEGIFATIIMTAGSDNVTCPITLSNVIVGDVQSKSVPVTIVNNNITIGNGQNQPPSLNTIGNRTINVNTSLAFSIRGVDPNDDPLVYSASNLPAGAVFDSSTLKFFWTPTSSQAGTYADVHFAVTDGTLSAAENITISVVIPSGGGGAVLGGGGGGAMPSGLLPLQSISNISGVFSQNLEVKSPESLAGVVIDSGTKGLTKDGKAISTISVTNVQLTQALPEQSTLVSKIYDFSPDGATFDRPVKLTLTYDPALVPQEFDKNDLVLATFDAVSKKWVNLESTVDPFINTVKANSYHFSMYCILANIKTEAVFNGNIPTPNTEEPTQPKFIINELNISSTEVTAGNSVTITASITNTGNISGNDAIILKINGVVEEKKLISVGAGAIEDVSFAIVKQNPGSYAVDLNGLSTSFVVIRSSSNLNVSFAPTFSTETNGQVNSSIVEDFPLAPTISSAPTVKEFSLSLLSKIIGGAFLFILVTVVTVVVDLSRRNRLLKKVKIENG